MIAGTGSVCCGCNEKGELRSIGGWGHLIGDEGSGYAIGRDMLTAVTHYWDGYGEETSLAKELKKMLLNDRQKLIAYVYENNKSNVAKLARLTVQEAAAGDDVAKEILCRNARELSKQVKTLATGLSIQTGEVALLGGLLENDTLYRAYLVEEIRRVCPELVCVAPRQNALIGAVLMAQII